MIFLPGQVVKLHDFHKTAGMPILSDEQALAHIQKRNKPLEYESFTFFIWYWLGCRCLS